MQQPAMTSDDVLRAATEEWLHILGRLWSAVGKPMEVERVKVYQEELSQVPMEVLTRAVSRCIRENRYASVPTIGDVWAAVKAELGVSRYGTVEDAIDDWEARRWMKVAWQPQAVDRG